MRFEAARSTVQKREKLAAIVREQTPALMLGGFMGTDMRTAKAAYEGGCRIFEPNHPAMALQMGLGGATTMNEAEQIRHLVPIERMVTAVEGIRAVCGWDVFVTCGVRGTFTEEEVTRFTLDDALMIARAGADSLHTHKSDIEDVREIAENCHKAGLLCEAYIDYNNTFGVQARTNEELLQAIKNYEEAGVDILGIESGMIYQGQESSEFNEDCISRIKLFLNNTHVFTSLEGGVKEGNMSVVKKLGFDILVMSTALDNVICDVTTQAVKRCLSL